MLVEVPTGEVDTSKYLIHSLAPSFSLPQYNFSIMIYSDTFHTDALQRWIFLQR